MHFHKWHYPTRNTRICLKCAEMQKQVEYDDSYWVLKMDYDEWIKAVETEKTWNAAETESHIKALNYVARLQGKMI